MGRGPVLTAFLVNARSKQILVVLQALERERRHCEGECGEAYQQELVVVAGGAVES